MCILSAQPALHMQSVALAEHKFESKVSCQS